MNTKEPCQKSADSFKTFRSTDDNLKIINTDFISEINSNCVLSENLQTVIDNHKNILFIIDKNIHTQLLLSILKLAKPKLFKIILTAYARQNITLDDYKNIFTADIFDTYKSSFIEYDVDDAKQFDFFGSTRYKSTILLHKMFLTSDLVIPIGKISYDILYGFTAGKSMIFTGIAHRKSTAKFASLIIDEKNKKINSSYKLTDLSNNPFSDDASGATLIARSEVTYFAINYIETSAGDIFKINSGDLFVSHIEMVKIFNSLTTQHINDKKPDGEIIKFHDSRLQDIVSHLYAVIDVMDTYVAGSNISIYAEQMKETYSKDFIDALATENSSELIERLKTDFNYDILLAFVLKYLTAKYNILINSNLDIKTLKQSGLKITQKTGIIKSE